MGIIPKRKKDRYYLSLDIGTEFVKCLIFRVDEKEGKGIIIGAGKQRQKLGDMQGGAVTDIGGVVENCDKAISRAEKMAGVSPTECVIGIAGELVKGTTTTIHYERLNPKEKIDYTELNNILNKVQYQAFEQTRKQLAWETGYKEIEVKLVNAAVVDVHIDGYHVTNPIGFQGRDVSIGIYNAFAPLVHLGALQTISSELGLDLISVAAEPYAVARCMGGEESTEFSAIFIDIGGGTSDIAVVRNGGVEGTKMFAIGGRTFTKRLAQVLNTTFAKAEEAKIMHSSGELDKDKKEIIREAILNDAEVWLSGVELSLGEFDKIDMLPSRILLCGGGSELPEIKEVLEKGDWWKNLPFAKKPKIKFMEPEDVANMLDNTNMMKSVQDITPMALGNLLLDYEEDESISGILKKVVKVMQV
ncbi:TPA: hypothetical protein DDW69_00380 [candidate division CPR2 bacterium]|uniref:Cell division protein (Septum formation) n=1 Tax=candidate division CPR2 bacterium GW2011_GWC1_41_48 TaxID=1618344 RepID=A0A0G0W754_UNCC2|nr:MAG: cell division protein (septum formation) [candidate division CPR2 bacterium GW2011_GWC2_39_35]KKR27832.1 MAG: cell division protein (septum formation) [candidate division CPR2 bacterium GW2011_GWD2_39_7]KKS08795.1 MAG: cell division protein (septum formation) [candidate division CPR2 bacterium GW2011_GWC1_41_48]OGB71908.1 MAG: hypothetical protein A2Y26_02055 [candidate division CPR2 bacterium GWD2_39_7]HBG81280.1 hypothetical protein [candidate division CPR2 bacterium]